MFRDARSLSPAKLALGLQPLWRLTHEAEAEVEEASFAVVEAIEAAGTRRPTL